MIKKFIEIKGVGRFADYTCKGDVELRQSTIIYAENGNGKTTLTNVLRSLASRESYPISRRKTAGQTTSQSIKILFDNSNHTYRNGAWEPCIALPKIEVFDVFFVNKNIYSGFEPSPEHGKGLYKFVIGEEGVRLSQRVKKLKEEIAAQRKDLGGLGKSIEREIGSNSALNTFLNLPKELDIENKLEEISKAIIIANEKNTIITTNSLKKLNTHTIPFDIKELKKTISTTLETISKEFITNVEDHKERLNNSGLERAEEWIAKGFKALNGSLHSCPFCYQPIDKDTLLIQSYNQYFSEEYIQLQENVLHSNAILDAYNISNFLLQLQNLISSNQSLISFWKKYVDVDEGAFSSDFQSAKLEELLIKVKATLKNKVNNLLTAHSLDAINNFSEAVLLLNQALQAYNNEVQKVNIIITTLKETPSNFGELEARLKQLKLIQKRYYSSLAGGCADYQATEQAINSNVQQKDELQEQLSAETTLFFNQYSDKINEHIRSLMPGSTYAIEKIQSSYSGRSTEPEVQYTLTLNGSPITSNENSNSLSFRYTLSEGDKTSLAFAFFLAKLDLQDLSDKIIVFDDPISSLDRQRRRKTIAAITRLIVRAKQVITLSHNENFIYDLYENPSSSNPKVLKIVYGGKIESYDNVEDEMQSDYFKSLKSFDDFIESPDELKVNEIRGSIRTTLESNLKFRFHKYLKKVYFKKDGSKVGPYTGKSGLGSIIDILEASDCSFRNDKATVIASLRDLNQISMNDHHGTIDRDHRMEPMETGELVGYIRETLLMIYSKL